MLNTFLASAAGKIVGSIVVLALRRYYKKHRP